MKIKLTSFVFLFIFLFPSIVISKTYRGVVSKVIDGDTVEIKGERVRLIGIDTPEIGRRGKYDQCFARAAAQYVRKRIQGKKVKYVTDEKYPVRDKYKRLLAYIYDKEGFLNADLVEKGYAQVYRWFKFKYRNSFDKLQRTARRKNLGLWGECRKTK